LSWNRIFDENNKFIDNGTLTLVAFVSFWFISNIF
jgi:hypothetical protein